MNEFNILKYLNDINLKNVFAFIELPKGNKRLINQYMFQATDENNEFVTGYINIFNNQIIINYKSKDTEHLFSSKITLYTAYNYTVTTEHCIINSKNEKVLIDRKIGNNIEKKNIFSFIQKQKKLKKKNLVSY
mgnify:FL=1